MIFLEAETQGVVAEIRINDVPFLFFGHEGPGRAFMPAPAYVTAGRNRLSARVFAPQPQASPPPRLVARLAIFAEGDRYFTGAGRELARLEAPTTPPLPLISTEFSSDIGPVAWSWARCQAWPSAELAQRDAADFISALVVAFYGSDTAWFDAASEPKLRDMAQAFPNVTLEEMRELTRGQLAQTPVMAPPQAPLAPVLCADARLLDLVAPNGLPGLTKADADGAPVSANALIGKLDGRWQVIR